MWPPAGWTVKNTGTCSPAGIGIGVRFTGIAVIPIRYTGLPSASVMRIPFGRFTARPGIAGVVSVTFLASGSVTVTSSAVSSTGKYDVNGSVFAPARSRTCTLNTPNERWLSEAVRPSISRIRRPGGSPVRVNRPRPFVRARRVPMLTVTRGSGVPAVVRMVPVSEARRPAWTGRVYDQRGRPCRYGESPMPGAAPAARPACEIRVAADAVAAAAVAGAGTGTPRTGRGPHRAAAAREDRAAATADPDAADPDTAVSWMLIEPVPGPSWLTWRVYVPATERVPVQSAVPTGRDRQ